MAHFLLPGFRVTPLVQWRSIDWVANEIHFVIAYLHQKGVEHSLYSCIIGLTLKNIHALLANLWAVFMCHIGTLSTQTL